MVDIDQYCQALYDGDHVPIAHSIKVMTSPESQVAKYLGGTLVAAIDSIV